MSAEPQDTIILEAIKLEAAKSEVSRDPSEQNDPQSDGEETAGKKQDSLEADEEPGTGSPHEASPTSNHLIQGELADGSDEAPAQVYIPTFEDLLGVSVRTDGEEPVALPLPEDAVEDADMEAPMNREVSPEVDNASLAEEDQGQPARKRRRLTGSPDNASGSESEGRAVSTTSDHENHECTCTICSAVIPPDFELLSIHYEDFQALDTNQQLRALANHIATLSEQLASQAPDKDQVALVARLTQERDEGWANFQEASSSLEAEKQDAVERREQLDTFETTLKTVRDELEEKTKECSVQDSLYAEITRVGEATEHWNKRYKDEKSSHKKTYEDLKAAHAKLKLLEEEKSDAWTMMANFRTRAEQLQSELMQAKAHEEEMKKHSGIQTEELRALKKAHMKQSTELGQYKTSLKSLEKANLSNESKIAQYTAALTKQSEKNADLRKEREEIAEQLERLKRSSTADRSNLTRVEKELAQLNASSEGQNSPSMQRSTMPKSLTRRGGSVCEDCLELQDQLDEARGVIQSEQAKLRRKNRELEKLQARISDRSSSMLPKNGSISLISPPESPPGSAKRKNVARAARSPLPY